MIPFQGSCSIIRTENEFYYCENVNLFIFSVDCSFLTFETPHCLSWVENIFVTIRDQLYNRIANYMSRIVFRANRGELSTLDDYEKY